MFKVLECVAVQHDHALVALAAGICVVGMLAFFLIHRRAVECSENRRKIWLLVAAVTGGLNSRVAISSTTFPSDFGSNVSQEIYERSFFNAVNAQAGNIIYSDRGSARAVEQSGGGVPRPRIDLPTDARWHFFRSDCVREENEEDDEFRGRRIEAYGQMADSAVGSADWDERLNIWGTQLIKITQLRSQFGITSPAKSTACRINIHLAKQSLYGLGVSSEELEEDWVD